MIAAVENIPEQAQKRARAILAYGEVTGHSHRIETPGTAEVWEYGNNLYLQVLKTARVIHEEHHPITLPPGTYRVWQQREYTPEAIRIVRD